MTVFADPSSVEGELIFWVPDASAEFLGCFKVDFRIFYFSSDQLRGIEDAFEAFGIVFIMELPDNPPVSYEEFLNQ